MSNPIFLYSYVEDAPSAEVAKKIVQYVNAQFSTDLRFVEGFPSNQHGVGKIRKKFQSLLEMAKSGMASFVLVDLDAVDCAPSLVRAWVQGLLPSSAKLPERFVFRVAVREIESWIMADRGAFARFLGIPAANFSSKPDRLVDPKQHLLNVLRQKGQKRWHREMLPQRPTAVIGPLYNEKLCGFIENKWNPARARKNSPSLSRAIDALCRDFGEGND